MLENSGKPPAGLSGKRTIDIDTLEERAHHIKKSVGEKIFDWVVYGGISGLGVFIATLPLTFSAKYGKAKALFEKGTKYLEHTPLSGETVERIMDTTALSMSGNISIIPIKFAEDRKKSIVGKINKMLGGDANAPISNEKHPQTWGSLIKGRVLAWVAVFAGFKTAVELLGKERFENYENAFAENIVCKPLGKPTHIGEKIFKNETKAFRYGKIAALDIYATIAATSLLYLGSRLFAKPVSKTLKPEADNLVENLDEVSTSPAPTVNKGNERAGFSHAQKIMAEQNTPQMSL
jgi:hypothetical protein